MPKRKHWSLAAILANTKPNGDCLEFTGYRNPDGYGRVWFCRKSWVAHRLVAILAHKATWTSPVVRHTCDNPACINPDHLLGGTYKQNSQDRDSRGRANTAFGERAGPAKLTEAQAQEILDRYVLGTGVLLAREFGVTQSAICSLTQRRTWKHLSPAV